MRDNAGICDSGSLYTPSSYTIKMAGIKCRALFSGNYWHYAYPLFTSTYYYFNLTLGSAKTVFV